MNPPIEVQSYNVMRKLEDKLCLDTVLHIVARSSGSNLGVEVSDISLQFQVVLVEVVGNAADLLGLEVIAYITVWIKL
jgi:hypothetical protein